MWYLSIYTVRCRCSVVAAMQSEMRKNVAVSVVKHTIRSCCPAHHTSYHGRRRLMWSMRAACGRAGGRMWEHGQRAGWVGARRVAHTGDYTVNQGGRTRTTTPPCRRRRCRADDVRSAGGECRDTVTDAQQGWCCLHCRWYCTPPAWSSSLWHISN